MLVLLVCWNFDDHESGRAGTGVLMRDTGWDPQPVAWLQDISRAAADGLGFDFAPIFGTIG